MANGKIDLNRNAFCDVIFLKNKQTQKKSKETFCKTLHSKKKKKNEIGKALRQTRQHYPRHQDLLKQLSLLSFPDGCQRCAYLCTILFFSFQGRIGGGAVSFCGQMAVVLTSSCALSSSYISLQDGASISRLLEKKSCFPSKTIEILFSVNIFFKLLLGSYKYMKNLPRKLAYWHTSSHMEELCSPLSYCFLLLRIFSAYLMKTKILMKNYHSISHFFVYCHFDG